MQVVTETSGAWLAMSRSHPQPQPQTQTQPQPQPQWRSLLRDCRVVAFRV